MAACSLESAWTWSAATGRAAPLTLVAGLDQLHDEFQQVASEAAAFAAPLSDAQFAWKPAADVWSIAECLSHLTATARMCMPKLDEGIEGGLRAGLHGQGPFRYGWADRLIVRAFGPSTSWHVRSPRAFLPVPGQSRQEVLSAFDEVQRQFTARLRRAHGLDLARVGVTSPVAPWLRFSLGAAFAVLAAHERRHLQQARRVTTLPQFPR
jgi:hypothetical protein